MDVLCNAVRVETVVISPDGSMFAVCLKGKKMFRVFDFATHKLLFCSGLSYRVDGSYWFDDMAFVPHAPHKLLVASSNRNLLLFDIPQQKLEKIINKGSLGLHRFVCIKFSHDGKFFATVSGRNHDEVYIFDTSTYRFEAVQYPGVEVCQVAISCDNKLLAMALKNDTIHVCNPHENVLIATIQNPHRSATLPFSLSFSPTHSSLLVSTSASFDDSTLCLWDGATGAPQEVENDHRGCLHAEFVKGGEQIITIANLGKFVFHKVSSGKIVRKTNGCKKPEFPIALAIHPDGTRAINISSDNIAFMRTLCEWKPATHRFFTTSVRRAVFQLMCVRHRLLKINDQKLRMLPIEVWLIIFECVSLAPSI